VNCSKYHAFADATLHFARSQVGDHHGVFPNQVFGLVGAGDAAEDVSGLSFAHVQRQAQQLDGPFDRFAIDDFGDAQVDFGEVVDGDGGGGTLDRSDICTDLAVNEENIAPTVIIEGSLVGFSEDKAGDDYFCLFDMLRDRAFETTLFTRCFDRHNFGGCKHLFRHTP